MPKKGWTWRRARFFPLVARAKLFRRLCRDTWRYREAHGGTAYVLWSNFRLATWLRP